MGALDYISYIIMAALFLSLAVGLYAQYMRANEEQRFRSEALELAERLSALARQDPGTTWYQTIRIPSWCELGFWDNSMIIRMGGAAENVPVGVRVDEVDIGGGEVTLKLERTENGIRVTR